MVKKHDESRATLQAEKFHEMAKAAEQLGKLRQRPALVRGLLENGASNKSRVIVAFDEGKDAQIGMHRSYRDAWDILVLEDLGVSTPILGATETVLREQIRKQESSLREMGVTDV